MIKLIIFDWDDVFTLGSTKGYYACYHETLKKLGVVLSEDEEIKRIKAKWGSKVEDELGELLKEKPELLNQAVEIYENILMGNTFVDCLTIVEGSVKLLENLSYKYKLAVASGVNPKLLKQKIFTKFGIGDIFSEILTVYDIDDPSHAKPHPYLILKIMEKLQIKPEETVMVGDAKNDVMMAKSAGVTPIAVLTGHLNKSEAEELGVQYIIEDVTKIEEVLAKL